jgi:arylsulfatase A-like enzyme
MPTIAFSIGTKISLCARYLVACILCVASCWYTAAASEPPNIVFILADDLGYGDVGCYNPDSRIPTPRLDEFATQGMRFTDAHSPSSVCTPTRYALLTGRYAWRTRLQRNVLGPWGEPLIADDRLTVGRMLQQHGYVTACIGKWHLGQSYVTIDGKPAKGGGTDGRNNVDFTKPIEEGPITRGFDHYFGTFVPNYPPYCFIEDDRTVGVPSEPMTGENFNIPGPAVPGWKLEDILPELTKHAVGWIEEKASEKKPFFLYFALTSPHYPVVPSGEFVGTTPVGAYGDFVYQTDWSIGQVLDALERAGVAENTLVIFTSDNGAEITGEVSPGAYDRIQQFGHHSSGKLRGAKRDAWEGGHRVPFIARWPGKVRPGSVSDETVCHVDFMATVAAILGEQLPNNAAEDSFNILPVLIGDAHKTPIREATIHHSARGKFAIRQGDWVLIDAPSGDDNGVNGEPAWLKTERGYTPHPHSGELFNLREDPSQRDNRYAEKPELVNELINLLKKIITEGRSTPGIPQANDVEINMKSLSQKGADPLRLGSESDLSKAEWLDYPGSDGPGKGKHVVLIAAEQEYRSEQSMPMLAKVLSKHHGFRCTVLFGVNDKGEVDPTLPVYPEKGREADFKKHHIPGLDQLASADLVIFCTRLLTLPERELQQIVEYVDSGKPMIALRTANHGFRGELPYTIDGKQVRWGEDVLGGTFLNHHGRWQADSTRGIIDKEQLQHPIVAGITDIWGDSDVYRTYPEGSSLPTDCVALVWGQPLQGRQPDDLPNKELEPLPVAWVKPWKTGSGKIARVFHCTMGSATDLKSEGLRRLIVNAVYWTIGIESAISPHSKVDIVGRYEPLKSGFNYKELGVLPRPVSYYW